MTRNIRQIVAQFRTMSDRERYFALSEILAGDGKNAADLRWRAKLCTALEKAKVYPQDRYEA